jgi:hypothetical protein
MRGHGLLPRKTSAEFPFRQLHFPDLIIGSG